MTHEEIKAIAEEIVGGVAGPEGFRQFSEHEFMEGVLQLLESGEGLAKAAREVIEKGEDSFWLLRDALEKWGLEEPNEK